MFFYVSGAVSFSVYDVCYLGFSRTINHYGDLLTAKILFVEQVNKEVEPILLHSCFKLSKENKKGRKESK